MENLEYIDNYFSGQPAAEEITQFEKHLTEDAVFAEEVAFYLSALQVVKDEAAEEKKRRFAEIYQQNGVYAIEKPTRKLWPYLAAAAVVSGILFGWYLFVQPAPTQQFAGQYIKDNFQTLSVTMSALPDSLQAGLRLYNDGKLANAMQHFEAITRSDTSDFTAKKYAGITALRLEHYDTALKYFDELQSYKDLHANPGKFYQAVTYLKRNGPGDIRLAKQLLQEVINLDLEGKETAGKWLKKL